MQEAIDYLLDKAGLDINNNFVARAMPNTRDPLSSLQEVGHTILAFAWGGVTFAVGAEFLKSVPWVGSVVSSIDTVLWTIIASLFLLGILLAYYLPFIPLIQWISGIAGYALFLFESFFGAIFWAAAHAMPEEGAGVAGQHAKQGYMLLLALLVRPALMVVGLFGGIMLSTVLVNFAGDIAYPFFSTVHGSNTAGLVGWLSGIFLLTLVTLSIVRRSFNLIFELPDRVIRWVGHSGEHLGENNDEQEIKQRFFAAMSATSGSAKGAAQGIKGMQDGVNSIKNEGAGAGNVGKGNKGDNNT